ncbi:protein CHUP1, chloroplastic isoform X2 [Impatiens glandulifera]|uniref:protein CHUP1, chloroplastic isoform X2 n=1 Tax=Impatiens glandulifera TaxID=253017 RepID=UPI001FB1059F|nr:protein CHUP1, chloroplastic isoform X2 [Impatiens glandulifera]
MENEEGELRSASLPWFYFLLICLGNEMTMSREKKGDIRPFLFKFGLTVALSLGGIVYSVFKNNLKIKQSQSSPEVRRAEKEIDQRLNPVAIEKHDDLSVKENISVNNLIASLSPSHKYNEEKDEFLISEFMELVKDFDVINTSQLEIETRVIREDYEEEIKKLKNTVNFLKEKERSLEFQLLEYYGLKEQEIASMELKNRLKIKNTEAKQFALKVELLQEDNRRLKSQVADHTRIAVELDLAMKEIEFLKGKLRSIDEHNKEQLRVLKERVQKMQEDEAIVVTDVNTRINLQRLSYLEEEAQSLRMSNQNLLLEISDLSQKLEHTQMLANSVFEDTTAEELKKETDYLKKEVEQLKSDRCADAEELVYLKWINACLRYELRNYQPESANKTVASNLSITLSPESEEKAKQLILEYADMEETQKHSNTCEKGINNSLFDFDFDGWSSSSQSNRTESSSIDNKTTSSSSSTRMKVIRKLKKLLELGKTKTSMDLSRSSSDIQTITRSVNVDNLVIGRSNSDVGQGEEKLVKYAEVIRDSYGEMTYNRVRRVSSSVSF